MAYVQKTIQVATFITVEYDDTQVDSDDLCCTLSVGVREGVNYMNEANELLYPFQNNVEIKEYSVDFVSINDTEFQYA